MREGGGGSTKFSTLLQCRFKIRGGLEERVKVPNYFAFAKKRSVGENRRKRLRTRVREGKGVGVFAGVVSSVGGGVRQIAVVS